MAEAPAPLSLREAAPLRLLDLRGDAGAPDFASAVASVLGTAPPTVPNTVAESGDIDVLWLGPDEWLVAAPVAAAGDLASRLETALAGQHHLLCDVSEGRVVLELEGAEARAVLAQGLSLDLHPRVFGPGRCAQTGLARVPVILQQIDTTPRFRIFVRRSFAAYVAEWLGGTIGELAAS